MRRGAGKGNTCKLTGKGERNSRRSALFARVAGAGWAGGDSRGVNDGAAPELWKMEQGAMGGRVDRKTNAKRNKLQE
eukprot:7370163-Pyramimonas_sp.AAC.1